MLKMQISRVELLGVVSLGWKKVKNEFLIRKLE
jgi:hypothetical protein